MNGIIGLGLVIEDLKRLPLTDNGMTFSLGGISGVSFILVLGFIRESKVSGATRRLFSLVVCCLFLSLALTSYYFHVFRQSP